MIKQYQSGISEEIPDRLQHYQMPVTKQLISCTTVYIPKNSTIQAEWQARWLLFETKPYIHVEQNNVKIGHAELVVPGV